MSRLKCCVPGCLESGNADKILHTFPHPDRDRERFNAWIFAIGGEIIALDNDFIFKQRRICRAHFEKQFLCRNNRISNNGIPSLHLKDYYNPLQVSSPIKTVYHYNQPQPTSGRLQFVPIAPKPTLKQANSTDTPPAAEDSLEDSIAAVEDNLEEADQSDDTDHVQFSWQNRDQISLDEDNDSVLGDGPSTVDMVKESKSTGDGEADQNYTLKNDKHTEYYCDGCSQEIIGYTCVQCENYDLCGACEARRLHARHYVLRVPGHRPFSEVNSILQAVREKIKLLTEEAQNDSTGPDMELEEIKLEEPEFQEVTVDPFSDVASPVDIHTSEPPLTSDETSDTTHTNDTTAAVTHTSEPRDQSKAPVKIVMPTDVFLKAFNMNPLVGLTSASHTVPHTKSGAPTIVKRKLSSVSQNTLDCRVELTRLPKTYTQEKSIRPFSHSNDKPIMEVIDLERRYYTYKRQRDMKQETYGDVRSKPVINIGTVKSGNQVEIEITTTQKSSEVEVDSEVEYLDEDWLEDETEVTINQNPISEVGKNAENTTGTQFQEYLSETWLDDTLEVESQKSS